jgi:hypothetical protein
MYISSSAIRIDFYGDFSLLFRLQTAGTSHRCGAASRGGEFFYNERLISLISEFKNIFRYFILLYSAEIVAHFIEMDGWSCIGKVRKNKQQEDC